MIEFFVKRPVTTIMFVAVFVVLGLVAFFNLRIEKQPKIDFPIVTVSAVYPGATPSEVETSVITKVEDAISELSEVKKVQSRAYDNFGYIFVQFLLEADINIKFIEVKDKVEAIVNDLPDDMQKPIVAKFDPFVAPVMDLVISSDNLDGGALYELADKQLRDKLSSVAGVANVSIFGGRERQINVILDPILMKQHYVDIRDVIASISAKNRNVPGGTLETEDHSVVLRFVGEFESVDEIAKMILITRDGGQVRLSDIGRVEDGFKKLETLARYNGKNVVGLSLEKVSDGNAVAVSKEVRRRLGALRAALPPGVSLELAADTTKFIVDETVQTEVNIFLGVLCTIAILYLFTSSTVSTFVASLVLPISIISAVFLVDLSGFSINMMTLLAVATALGTLIANAIVIVENCLAHVNRGEDKVTAAINGTKEVTTAVLASTGTNIVVFAPLAFMGDIVGQFMRSFGLTVIYVTIASLFVSFTLTPMLCGLLLSKEKGKPFKWNPFRFLVTAVDWVMQWMLREYRRFFDFFFRFPVLTVLVTFLFFVSVKLILPYVGNDFFPKTDEDKINITLEMAQGSTIERTLEATEMIEKRVAKLPERISCLSYIGKNGVEKATLTVNLKPLAQRNRGDVEIIEELTPFAASIPDATITLKRSGDKVDDVGDICVHLFGRDYDEMVALSTQLKEKMEQTGYFRTVKSSYSTPKTEIRFLPDQSRLVAAGVRDIEVGGVIRASVYGDDSNIYKEGGEEYPISIALASRYTQSVEDIQQISIISRKGLMPVSELGTCEEKLAAPMIRRENKQRLIQLDGQLAKSNTGHVMKVVEEAFAGIPFPEGYGYRFAGTAEHQNSSSREISKAFFLAVIMTYMLLAAIMNSCFYPVPIILSIATSFVGVFYALFFLNGTINVASMLGMVMLVGLVVNNSILLLDQAMVHLANGVEIKDALWLAVSVRFRPIIMTSVAIILGVLPQLWSVMPVKSSMSIVMVGGMVASILFTFILTPISFWYVYRFKKKLAGVKIGT